MSLSATIVSLIVSILVVLIPVTALAEAAPFSLDLKSPRNIYKIGSSIDISIVLRNISQSVIRVYEGESSQMSAGVYIVDINRVGGKKLRLIDADKNPGEDGDVFKGGIYRSTNLQPNEILLDEICITDLYDLSEPGRYLVNVERKLNFKAEGERISSNTIVIDITR